MPTDLETDLTMGEVSPRWLTALCSFPCETVARYCGKQALAMGTNLCASWFLTPVLWEVSGTLGLARNFLGGCRGGLIA